MSALYDEIKRAALMASSRFDVADFVLDVLARPELRAEVIAHLGLRDFMVSVDSTCSLVAFRKTLDRHGASR